MNELEAIAGSTNGGGVFEGSVAGGLGDALRDAGCDSSMTGSGT